MAKESKQTTRRLLVRVKREIEKLSRETHPAIVQTREFKKRYAKRLESQLK